MLPLILPENYESPIDLMESQRAIKKIKDYFQQELAYGLNLRRVSAPLFVDPKTGLNDNLNGVERRVSFTLKDIDELEVEVVQSLAKWKRMALGKYAIEPGHGIYTDMNAIRRDEDLDNLHSVYVDQWDWEKVITKEQRTEAYLRETVTTIYNAIKNLGDYVNRLYRNIQTEIPNEIFFITTQELEDLYPDKTPKEREYLAAKSVAVFMTAGVSAVFPLLLNLMLTMTMFPVINYDWYQLPNYKALFMNLAVKNVIAYCIVYMALIFVFAGLIAGLALSLSLYANNRFVVLSLPFLICIVSGRLVAYSGNPVIRGLAIQKVFYVPQSSPTTLVSLCILFVVLVLCGYVHFMVRGVKMDVL